jgi:hypothetical protein
MDTLLGHVHAATPSSEFDESSPWGEIEDEPSATLDAKQRRADAEEEAVSFR